MPHKRRTLRDTTSALTNTSHRPTATIERLLAFVTGECPVPRWIDVLVADTEAIGPTTGRAYPAYTIKLWLGRSVFFPRDSKAVEAVGSVPLASWEEEVVFVLAHEMRHLTQFVAYEEGEPGPPPYTDEAEEDAELFAVTILNKYRAAGGKCAITPYREQERVAA